MPSVNEVHDQYVVDVSLNNQVDAGAAAVVRAFDSVQKSAQAAAADVSSGGDKIAAAYPQWDKLARKYDDVTAASNRLKSAEEALARAQEVSTIALQRGGDQDQVNRVLAEMADRVTIARQALLDLRAATDAASDADDRWGGAMGQLRSSVDSVFATSQRYAQQLDQIATASATLGLSQEQQAVLVDKLNASYAQSAAPLSGYVNSTEAAAAAAAAAADAATAYQATLDSLQSRYSATAAAAKQFATASADIATLEAEGKLTADEAAAALDAQAAAYDKVTAAARSAAAASSAAMESSQLGALGLPQAPTAAQSTSREADANAAFGAGLTEAAAQYSAVTAAQQRMSAESTKLNTLLQTGLITTKEFTTAMTQLQTAVDKTSQGLAASSTSLAQHQFATRQAGVQMIQFFTSIEAGQPIFIAFIQQAHQMVDVAVVTGTGFGVLRDAVVNAFRAIGTAIAANPIVAGIAVIAGALTAVAVAAESSEAKLLSVQSALRATRTDYVAAAADVVAAAKAVEAETGGAISAADARAAGTTIKGAFNFAGTNADMRALVVTAGDLATVMGKTVPEAAKTMATVLDDPAKAAKDLAEIRLPGMSFAIADTIRHMAQMGDAAGATKLAMEVIQAAVDGARKESLTPLQVLLESITEAFSKLGAAAASAGNAVVGAVANATRGQQQISDAEAFGPYARPGDAQQQQLPVPPAIPQLPSSVNTALAEAQKAIASTPLSDIQNRTDAIISYEKALMDLSDQGTTTGTTVDTFTRAIQENSRAIDDDIKKINQQVDALTKQSQQIEISIAAANRLTAAYSQGSAAVREANAQATAEKEILATGLSPDTREYTDAVAKRTQEVLRLNQANAGTDIAKDTQKLKDQTAAMQAEVRIAGESNTAREVRIAVTKAEQDLDAKGISVTSAAGQAYLAEAEALGRATGAKDDSTKKTNTHVAALVKQQETLVTSIASEQKLIDAYGQDAAAVAAVVAQQEVEKKLISDGLIPGTQKYNDELAKRAPLQQRLNQLNAEGDLGKQNQSISDQIQDIQAETETLGMNVNEREVYLANLKAEQELRAKNIPLQDATAQKYLAETAALTKATQAYQEHEQALSYLSGQFSQAFDTIGTALTQTFTAGQAQAVNWRNVMLTVAQQVIQAFAKLAIINPILNSLFGQNNVTLDSVAGVLGGLGSGTPGASTTTGGGAAGGATGSPLGLLGTGSTLVSGANTLTGGSLYQALGLTGIGEKLGLTGSNGIFSGLGSNISSFLSTPLFGTAGPQAAAAEAALGLPATAGPSLTIGGALSGVGLGFGAGSLAGGLVQGAVGKTGYGPQIGAGAGAVGGALAGTFVFPGVGTVLGGLIGGVLGGAGGGLIGPNVQNPYSLTNIGVNAQGQLTTGSSAFQKLDSNAAQTAADVKTVNDALNALGVKISAVTNTNLAPGTIGIGPGGVPSFGAVGSANPKGGDDFFATNVASAFSGFRFSANDPQVSALLQGQSFADPQALATAVQKYQAQVQFSQDPRIADFLKGKDFPDANALTQAVQAYQAQIKGIADFLDQTAAGLTKVEGTFQTSQEGVTKTYNDQIAAAQAWIQTGAANADETAKLTQSELDLADARDKALAANAKVIEDTANQQVQSLYGRYLTANAQVTGSPWDAQAAQLVNFDQQAQQQRDQLTAQWQGIFGDAYKDTWEYVNSSQQLERALGTERLAIQKQYNDQMAAAAAAAAAQQASLYGRFLTAQAAVTGNPADASNAAFYNIDNQAQQERLQLAAQYKALYGDAYTTNLDYIKTSVQLEQTLGEERLAAQKAADDAIAAQTVAAEAQREGLVGRYFTAAATISGDPAQALQANLYNFDVQAQNERNALTAQYKALYGDAYSTNAQFVQNSIQLEQTLGEERLAIQKQADDAIKAQMDQARASATTSITSLTSFAKSLELGSQSPLSPQQQLDIAQSQFNAVAGAAKAGDANSINQLQGYAQSLLTAAQNFWGSGQTYVDLFNQVVDTLNSISAESPDTLTASYFALQTQTQTQTLVEELQALRTEVIALRAQVASGSSAPGRIAA